MSQSPFNDDNPVRTGLVALVGVSLAVGLILAVVALVGTHLLGIGGGGGSSAGAGQGETMYLPPPEKTSDGSGPLITLNTQATGTPKGGATDASSDATATDSTSATDQPQQGQISLQALETTVPNFGKIDLTGVFPGGEGEILQVQRKQGSKWVDFAATVPVSNATFSTYIQTGVTGKNTFRVLDKSRNIASNPVDVTVG